MARTTDPSAGRPPREDLFRAMSPGVSLRDDDQGARPTMFGHFSVFDEWAEINSVYEGHFLERVVPGAFTKTIDENRRNMRVLFHHGRDQLGLQVLGAIDELREDEIGAYYEVGLFDGIPQLVLDGMRAGQYGSSYRFTVLRDEWVQRPRRSEHNPEGLPERTIRENRVREFGPTPFPAFAGATTGVRSMTDEMLRARLAETEADQDDRPAGISLAGLPTPEREEHHHRYERAVEYVGESPWAIHPGALATILQVIGERAGGHRPSPEEIRERIGARDAADETADPPQPGVAVVKISGPIIPKANLMAEMSGATSIERFRGAFREALASRDVTAIVLDIDSPGGAVEQVPEMASEIFEARGIKPIVAQANAWAASAAYWIASAADELIVTPSGEVGSVGVYSAHDDLTAAMRKLGVKTTIVKAGKYKIEANPFEPLGREAKAEMQRKVDAYYDMFVAAVAQGRGVTEDTVRDDFGQGRMLMSAEAVEAGMADRVATIDQTIARLNAGAETEDTDEPEPPEATTPPITRPEPPEATTGRTPTVYGTKRRKPSWQI